MDKYSLKLMEDIVLEARGSSKTNSHILKISARWKIHENFKVENFKVEIQTVKLSQESEKEIYDALKEIHGSSFQLADPSEFVANNSNTGKQIYLKRSNFIREVKNYSTKDICPKSHEEATSDFTTLKLETYNFDTSHCSQALAKTKGHMGKALELLFYKYYGIEDLPKKDNLDGENLNDVFERRHNEKEQLQLNSGDRFKEKIENRVWIFNVNLDYLIENTDEKQKIKYKTKTKPIFKDTCRLHLKENCTSEKECQLIQQHLDTEEKCNTIYDSLFTLEIRFPEDCKYPYEPPYFYFYKNDGTYPALDCLKIARKLHNEALNLCADGNPIMLSIISLLQNPREILCHLKENKEIFLDKSHSLFSESLETKQNFSIDNGTVAQLLQLARMELAKLLDCCQYSNERIN